MEFKRPKTFEDMLELQKYQDKRIISNKPRLLEHIKKSLIAECIEFDEETKDSHKTWKPHIYNKEKELEELVDIWFFIAQLVNYAESIGHISIQEVTRLSNFFKDDNICTDKNINVLTIIFNLRSPKMHYDWLKFLIIDLMNLSNHYGYTTKDILNGYWKKLNYNLNERIGKEWN